MTKLFTRILVCTAVAALLLSGLAVNATVQDPVVELKSPGEIVSVPGEDLFLNFKNLMPSMAVEQPITVKNSFTKTVNIYLKIESATFEDTTDAEQSKKLLDALDLKLSLKEPNGQTSEIFNEKASGTTDGKRILLGTYAPAKTGSITATVTMPAELGNDFQNLQGKTVWIFSCEEVVYDDDDDDDDDDDEDSSFITTAANVRMPETGGFPMLALLPVGAVLVVGGLLFGRKKP